MYIIQKEGSRDVSRELIFYNLDAIIAVHFAITGKTAAELIDSRADANKPTMGLTTWKNAPSGKILKSDVRVAKNYLNEEEIDTLNRLVVMFIDFAEMQAKRFTSKI